VTAKALPSEAPQERLTHGQHLYIFKTSRIVGDDIDLADAEPDSSEIETPNSIN
jgi:hypothetical protein